MSTEKCANRLHGLSTPPPVRSGARAPNDGCLPCVRRVAGECPYRGALGCTDADRDDGIVIGKCVFEVAQREEILRESLRHAHVLREEDRPALELAAHRAADATLYAQRALRWAGILSDRSASGPGPTIPPDVERAVQRYLFAGMDRQLRTLQDLAPLRAEVHRRKHEWSRILGEEYRRRDREDPTWRRPKRLVIPDLAQS